MLVVAAVPTLAVVEQTDQAVQEAAVRLVLLVEMAELVVQQILAAAAVVRAI